MKILNSEVKCNESYLPRKELFPIENHNDVVLVKVHKISFLGKPELHEQLNI